jgi:hypothetical protein
MIGTKTCKKSFLLTALIICSTLWGSYVQADSDIVMSKGQTVYVPVYSHIYGGNRERPFMLSVTLSIRNTDSKHTITVTAADYYDSDGKLLMKYIKKPVHLGKMASTRYIVKESDKAGGSGANFIVTWESESNVTAPLIESVMIGTQAQQGISFTSRGQVIK